ncbi:hypothetical protein ACT7DN_01850 [Bacillus paranthracis]
MQAAELSIKELKDIKSEVNNFIELEFNTLEELDRNNLRFVLKRVVFLKYLIRQSGDFRFQALTSDIIYLISSIKKGRSKVLLFQFKINN